MINHKKVVAIIPARGGSKRLPGKNKKVLMGKPLIAWTISTALQTEVIDKVIVSTDDLEIAKISKKYNAEVPFLRPANLSDDKATSYEVIIHSLNYLEKHNEYFGYILLLQPTSPLRNKEDINNTFNLLLKTSAKAIVSVCETDHSPLWSNTLPDDLSMKDFIRPEIKNLRSQDLPNYYRLNGAIYLAEIEYLKQNKSFLGEFTKAYIMPPNKSIDIDTKIDFELCKILLNENNKNNSKTGY